MKTTTRPESIHVRLDMKKPRATVTLRGPVPVYETFPVDVPRAEDLTIEEALARDPHEESWRQMSAMVLLWTAAFFALILCAVGACWIAEQCVRFVDRCLQPHTVHTTARVVDALFCCVFLTCCCYFAWILIHGFTSGAFARAVR